MTKEEKKYIIGRVYHIAAGHNKWEVVDIEEKLYMFFFKIQNIESGEIEFINGENFRNYREV